MRRHGRRLRRPAARTAVVARTGRLERFRLASFMVFALTRTPVRGSPSGSLQFGLLALEREELAPHAEFVRLSSNSALPPLTGDLLQLLEQADLVGD